MTAELAPRRRLAAVARDDQRLTLDDVRGRATITLPEAARLLGVGVNQAREAARLGQIPSLRIGDRRIVVPVPALIRLLEGDDSA